MTVTIAPATEAELPAIVSLLTASGLPRDGLADHLDTALVGREGASVVASAALELYGDTALLRFVAVAGSARRCGLGERITRAALEMANQRSLRAVYLLTTTAAGFFARRLGFQAVSRAAVPEAVRASLEFARLCPDTAQAMVCELPAPVVVLFACVHNAGRSQMAAALFNALADQAKARAASAGTAPAARVHPEVVSVMREVGIDLAETKPRLLTTDLAASGGLLVTMGCSESCPHVPGLRREDWPLEDPKGQPLERVRAIRDHIRERVAQLVAAEGWSGQATAL